MARRDVIEVKCDRCGRVETQTSSELPKLEGPEVEVTFHGEKTSFADLCKRCRAAVEGYISRVVKKAPDELPEKPEGQPEEAQTPEPEPTPTPDPGQTPKKKGFLGLGG